MLMIESMIFMVSFLFLNFNLYKKLYFVSNMMFLLSFLMLSMNGFFMDWVSLSMNFGLNFYSYGIIILILWIFGLVFMSINQEKNFVLCLNLLILMLVILLMNFFSMNMLMFYFFFEVSLLIIFFLIMKWGMGFLRIYASYYLMFYTLFFSLPLLLVLFYLFNLMGSMSFLLLEGMMYKLNKILFLYLIIGFLVKMPMYMIHGWLLKAHVEAPVFGSMILAAILLKLGSYGLLRLMMIFFQNFLEMSGYFIEIGLMGSIILSLNCFRQIDMKILVAMSSVVHMNLLMSSMFTMSKLSFLGSYLMMIAHGLCSSGLFYLLNLCYLETHSRLMIINKGVLIFMPSMSLMWFLMCSSNMAAPFSLNLVGEIFLLMSLVNWLMLLMIKLFFYCLISFMYSLYFFSFIVHGKNFFYKSLSSGKLINYLILLFHWIPLNLIILNLSIFI
uniref:NADH-ubiquinone oxidoreductase chain 4 n=1 Tax=Osmia excavata TaxID=124290 RepID=A0A2R2Z384_9HYME|nr:NADH dehydrogenase subunit 4 [Osmia excavata]